MYFFKMFHVRYSENSNWPWLLFLSLSWLSNTVRFFKSNGKEREKMTENPDVSECNTGKVFGLVGRFLWALLLLLLFCFYLCRQVLIVFVPETPISLLSGQWKVSMGFFWKGLENAWFPNTRGRSWTQHGGCCTYNICAWEIFGYLGNITLGTDAQV